MTEFLDVATSVFVFGYFAVVGAVVMVLMRDIGDVGGFLRHRHDAEGEVRTDRVAAMVAPVLVLFLYTLQVIDGWDAAVQAKSLPEPKQAYLAILASANSLYLARKMGV